MNKQQKRSVVIITLSAIVIIITIILHYIYLYNDISAQMNYAVKVFLFFMIGVSLYLYVDISNKKAIKLFTISVIIILLIIIFYQTPEKKIHGNIQFSNPKMIQFYPFRAKSEDGIYIAMGIVLQMKFHGSNQDRITSRLTDEKIKFTISDNEYNYTATHFVESLDTGTEVISSFYEVDVAADGITRHETLFYNTKNKLKWQKFIEVLKRHRKKYIEVSINSTVDRKPVLGHCKFKKTDLERKIPDREDENFGVTVNCIK